MPDHIEGDEPRTRCDSGHHDEDFDEPVQIWWQIEILDMGIFDHI